MKTRIKVEIQNEREIFIPQYKGYFWLFYLIPIIGIWKDFLYEFGDDCLLGLGLSSRRFRTKEEAELFLRQNDK